MMDLGVIGTLIGGVVGWEGIQYLLGKFFFDKKKDRNEENAGEIANLRGQFDIMRDLNTILNETVGRLKIQLEESEENQRKLKELLERE